MCFNLIAVRLFNNIGPCVRFFSDKITTCRGIGVTKITASTRGSHEMLIITQKKQRHRSKIFYVRPFLHMPPARSHIFPNDALAFRDIELSDSIHRPGY
jgi:hypothetical protein